MGGEWRTTTWGDLLSLEYGKSLRGYRDSQAQYRVFGSNGPIGWSDNYIAEGPGVILGRKGAYRGVEYSSEPFNVIDTAYFVRPKETLDFRWLYYAMKHYKVGEIDDGSPIPSTTRSAVYVSQLKVPPFEEQNYIAHILGTLDDKIELNRQTNETLEAMAQALFKSWFVDFDPVIDNALAAGNEIPEPLKARAAARLALGDARKPLPEEIRREFPDGFEFVDEMGWVPRGWGSRKIRDIGMVVTGKTPPKSMPGSYSCSGCSFITPSDIDADLFVTNTSRRLSKRAEQVLEKSKIPAGSVCVTCIGSQMGKVVINSEEAITNQQVNSIILNDSAYRSIVALNLRMRNEELRLLGSGGSTMPIVNKTMFENIELLLPSIKVIKIYGDYNQPFLDRLMQSKTQNSVVASVRDTLLPKLLSGQFTIPDAEKHVADVL